MAIDAIIRRLISEKGYIAIDELMNNALNYNQNSYYRNIKNIGAAGDFITSPEISQLFGEIITLWIIEKWQELGEPKKFNLIELGAGTGKLIYDIIRTSKILPKFSEAIKLSLLEINPNFIKSQNEKLSKFNLNINRLESIIINNNLPCIFIANEFFDALPVKQYLKIKEEWYEKIVKVDPNDGHLKFDNITIKNNLQLQLKSDHPNASDGAVIEESILSLSYMQDISNILKSNKGFGLIIDYGYYIAFKNRENKHYSSTLQAIKQHKFWPVLDSIGEADLTAHVDFDALIRAAHNHGIVNFKYYTQRDFLLKYGINIRLEHLKKRVDSKTIDLLENQVDRLISNQYMGKLFKVLELSNLSK